MLHTALCDLLGIELPILAAPMGPSITGPALAGPRQCDRTEHAFGHADTLARRDR